MLTAPKLLALTLIDDGIITAPIPFEITPFPTSLYWHEHTQSDAAQSWLRNLIIDEVKLD